MLTVDDNVTLGFKVLTREEYLIKNIGSIYQYVINDNIRRLVNISKKLNQG